MLESKKTTKKVVSKKAKSSDDLVKEWLKVHIEAKYCTGEDRAVAKKKLKQIELELRGKL